MNFSVHDQRILLREKEQFDTKRGLILLNNYLSLYLIKFTCKNIKKMTPCWSRNSVFSPLTTEMLCLFSSHLPWLFSLDGTLKFTEVHPAFLIHWWPHDNRLGELNRLTTCPSRRLFSRVVKYEEREEVKISSAAITAIYSTDWSRINKKTFAFSIIDIRSQYGEWCWLNEIFSRFVLYYLSSHMKFAMIRLLRNKTPWLVNLSRDNFRRCSARLNVEIIS